MDCFDPFKDYLELSFRRTDMMEHTDSEESPVPDIGEDRVTDIGWLTGSGTTDWKNSDVPGQWTPGSSSGESTSARPLLGRRDSTDDLLPQRPDVKLHSNSTQGFPKRIESASTTMSHVAGGAWGQECGAWKDMNSEISCGQTTPWNGNSQTVSSNNGLYSCTGFFANTDSSQNAECISRYASQTLNEGAHIATSYPRYSNGFNVEYPEAISHVALLLNRLMQQGSANVAEKNGFRTFSSLEEGKYCAFCKKNRERREFYTTHVVKDSWGKVICPILRKYICPNCGATGDNAHTLRHCPIRTNQDTL